MKRKIPSEDICALIEQHLEKYGFCSHLERLWRGQAKKKWKRDEMLEECLLELDTVGGKILHYAYGSQRKRSKIISYFHIKYPEMLGRDYKDNLISMLCHAARCYVSQPTESNKQNLLSLVNGKVHQMGSSPN